MWGERKEFYITLILLAWQYCLFNALNVTCTLYPWSAFLVDSVLLGLAIFRAYPIFDFTVLNVLVWILIARIFWHIGWEIFDYHSIYKAGINGIFLFSVVAVTASWAWKTRPE